MRTGVGFSVGHFVERVVVGTGGALSRRIGVELGARCGEITRRLGLRSDGDRARSGRTESGQNVENELGSQYRAQTLKLKF